MTRIYRHTIASAPGAARPLLEGFVPSSPTGKPGDDKIDSLFGVIREAATAGVAGSAAVAGGRG